MRPASAFVACTNRHFSATGLTLAFSFIAFEIKVETILPHFLAFVNE